MLQLNGLRVKQNEHNYAINLWEYNLFSILGVKLG